MEMPETTSSCVVLVFIFCIKCHWCGFREPDPPTWRRSLPSLSQGGDCGFPRPHGLVQSFSVWSQAFVFFFSPAPSLAQVSPSAHTGLHLSLPACRGQNTGVSQYKYHQQQLLMPGVFKLWSGERAAIWERKKIT